MIHTAIEAARDAGKYLRFSVGKVRHVQTKKGEERNLVSEIDKTAEERIIGALKRRYPSHAILAEESGATDEGAEYRWVIDPLDGTTNFLHGLPIFCVSIALEHRGSVVAGVIYDPNHDELFTAERCAGAYLNGKRLRVSATAELGHGLLVTGFPYDIANNPDHAVERFVDFLMAARGVRRLGSAALDLAYVGAGRFDGFWEVNLNPWDMAAGMLIVEEAGGRVSDFSGNPMHGYPRQIVASNGLIHDAMLNVLQRHG